MSITVLLLIALCLLCVVVFLKHNRQKETFFEQKCNNNITCPYGTSLHIVNDGTPDQQKACCSNQVNSNGYYLLNSQCEQCPKLTATKNDNYLNSFTTTSNADTTSNNSNNQDLFTSSNNSTIATCRAECKNGIHYAPYKEAEPGAGWAQVGASASNYDTSSCTKSYAYSNVHQDPQTSAYSNLTVQYRTADTDAPNYENSWCSNNIYSNNNSNYCCTDSNIPRYNSNAAPSNLGCCASNEYLSNDGSCVSCPNGGLCSNDLNQSGILCCQISNCMLSNSPNSTLSDPRDALWSDGNKHYSNNEEVTDIKNYGCYADYQYNKLSNITNGSGSNIVSSSNTIYFDGSNYNYLDDHQKATSNNIIGSNNIRTSNDVNWFYHHDSNENRIESNIDINIPERIYTPSDDYSRYYKCEANTFLRCTSNYASNSIHNCGCCSNNAYFNEDASSCSNIESSTVHEIASNQLYPVDLGQCLSGWGKSNFNGLNGTSNQCTQCTNLVYYDSNRNDNICKACPDGQYPNGMDIWLNSNCSNAPVLTGLSEDWYRFKYTDTGTDYYLTYSSNQSNYSIFKKHNDNFTYNGSNIYLWSNATDEVKIQLPKTSSKSGEFLKIGTPDSLQSGHYEDGSNFKVIPYCQPGHRASNLGCSACASNSYSSSYGAEECSNCPLNSFTSNQTRLSNQSSCLCPSGLYYISNECAPCPVNKYCPGGSITGEGLSNYNCPPNTVTDGTGKSTSNACSNCGDGKYFHSPTSTCSNCPANSSPNSNNTTCLCNGGFYLNSSVCSEVGFGWYSPDQNDGRQQCPSNSSTNIANASNLDQCECNPGYYGANGSTCEVCPVNRYCSGGTNIEICPENSSTTGNASNINQCVCNAGYYVNSGVCYKCQFNHKCTGGQQVQCDYGKYSLAGSSNCTECAIKFHYGNGAQYTSDANLSEGNDKHADWEITSGRNVCNFYLYKNAWGTGDCDNYSPGQGDRDRPIEGVGGEVTSVKVRSKDDPNQPACPEPSAPDCAVSSRGPTC